MVNFCHVPESALCNLLLHCRQALEKNNFINNCLLYIAIDIHISTVDYITSITIEKARTGSSTYPSSELTDNAQQVIITSSI